MTGGKQAILKQKTLLTKLKGIALPENITTQSLISNICLIFTPTTHSSGRF